MVNGSPVLTQFKLQSDTDGLDQADMDARCKLLGIVTCDLLNPKLIFSTWSFGLIWIQSLGRPFGRTCRARRTCNNRLPPIVFYPTYHKPCIEPAKTGVHNLSFMHKRVLIADDSSSVRDVIRTFLRDHEEIEICGEAVDGLEALEKAQSLKPDLVLLDLVMPEINGAEVASILKQKMPNIRIILFTMYTEKIGKFLSAAIGVDAVLSKPDGMAHMVESINSLFAD
jgi:CheY-like chemotaxis protein